MTMLHSGSLSCPKQVIGIIRNNALSPMLPHISILCRFTFFFSSSLFSQNLLFAFL